MSDISDSSVRFDTVKLEPFGPIGIIGHTANRDFTDKVNKVLSEKRASRVAKGTTPYIHSPGYSRKDYIFDTELVRFQTGEGKFVMGESSRGHDIFIITDVLSHNLTYDLTVGEHTISADDHYRDLIRMVSCCMGKAKRVNVIMPFVYEGRREKLDSHRESYDCAEMLQTLYNLGVSKLIMFDPHDERIANAVPLMDIEMPQCRFKIIQTLLDRFGSVKIDSDSTMVVSPDEMGARRAIRYSSILNLPLGIFYRDRDYSVKVNGDHPIKEFKFLGDDVEGKDILLIDDMINSGSTMARTSRKLKDLGAKDIYCLAPFGLFTDGLKLFDDLAAEGIIKAVLCTNLIYRTEELLQRSWYVDVDMVPYVARIIDAINLDESVYDLINSTDRIEAATKQIRLGELFDEFNE
ncbi:MAG: ribose-phosphate diphosphokinase [Clostridiales bacterium]|nr:ribose-phosphate diphosphokinase [Clostridiales bacterium]